MKQIFSVFCQLIIPVVFFFIATQPALAQNGVRIAGTSGTADPSAMLDIVSTNKGVLFPRVCLASLTANSSPVTNPQAGLVIYNTGACGIAATGLYFWNGSSWVFLNTGGFSAAGTTNYLPVFTASNALGSSVVYQSGNNVGIGTSSPLAKLNINGSGTALSGNGIIVGTVGSSITTAGAVGAETGRFEIAFPGWRDVEANQIGAKIAAIRKNNYQPNNALVQSTELAFYTGTGSDGGSTSTFLDLSTERMRIDQNGNVGIGTATPASKLDVVGDIKVSGRIYGAGIASYAVARTQSGFTPPTSMSAASGSGNEVPGLSVSITTHGGDLEIEGTFFIQWNTTNTRGEFSASIDGVWVGSYIGSPWPATWSLWYDGIIGKYAGGADWDTRTYHRIVTNVPAGTHTVKMLAWNESTNGWYINCCSMVSEMVVKELLKQN